MALTSEQAHALYKDGLILVRVKKRLGRDYERLGTWRAVAEERGVNHGNISLAMHGHIPKDGRIRKALGFPAVMPSERRAYVKKVHPLIGSDGWEEVYFKKIKGRKTRGVK